MLKIRIVSYNCGVDILITWYAYKLNELWEMWNECWIWIFIVDAVEDTSISFNELFLKLFSVILCFTVIGCSKLDGSSETFVHNSEETVKIWFSEFFCWQEYVTKATEYIEFSISVEMRRLKNFKEFTKDIKLRDEFCFTRSCNISNNTDADFK